MIRRLLCLLCVAMMLFFSVSAFSEPFSEDGSYDFDLTFRLNADSFPDLLRARAAGYAALVNRLGLRGNVSWNSKVHSFDLYATLYFTDDSSLTYPLHIYGVKSRIFISSPMIGSEVILLNMGALMEFSIKAKNTLGLSLSYLALLIPYTTESALSGLIRSWQEVIGTFTESGEVSVDQFHELSVLWQNELLDSNQLRIWISGVAGGSDAPEVVESELYLLPEYLEKTVGSQPVSVTVGPGSEVWRNVSGETLFSRQESGGISSVSLSLPVSQNGYLPSFSYVRRNEDQTFDMEISASLCRNASANTDDTSVSDSFAESDPDEYGYETGSYSYDDGYDTYDGNEEYDIEYDDDEYGQYEDPAMSEAGFPETLLKFRFDGSGFPRTYPSDSSFALTASVLGAVYPDYTFRIMGETKKDGAVTLSLAKPFSSDSEPVEIFRCEGTFFPAAEPKTVPNYLKENMDGYFNVFSFNEQRLNTFTEKVIPPLIRSIFSFVAAAPTSACQSFLDDLTEIGVLDMLLE